MDVGDAAGNPMIRNALGDSFPASPEVTLRLCREAGIDEYSHVLHLGAGVDAALASEPLAGVEAASDGLVAAL